jgi:hypothetical protein
VPALSLFAEVPGLDATVFQCPQCRSCAKLKVLQAHPRFRECEWRTFECDECGLPRTYAVSKVLGAHTDN